MNKAFREGERGKKQHLWKNNLRITSKIYIEKLHLHLYFLISKELTHGTTT